MLEGVVQKTRSRSVLRPSHGKLSRQRLQPTSSFFEQD
jgi:hypothetical protein